MPIISVCIVYVIVIDIYVMLSRVSRVVKSSVLAVGTL